MCLNYIVPTKEMTGKTKPPWINRNIKSLSRRKQRLYNRARQSGLPDDWSLYYQVKKQAQQQCRKVYNAA